MKFFLLINVKMPTTVGVLTFMSRKIVGVLTIVGILTFMSRKFVDILTFMSWINSITDL